MSIFSSIRGARRRRLAAVVAAGSVLTLVPATSTEASSVVRVDVTVAETLPLSVPGEVTADSGLEAFGCLGADVETFPASVTTRGDVTRFTGTKDIECADGTLTISYRARVRGCATTDRGVWRVVGGTGDFAGARGGGRLVGTYTGGAGNACDNTGIDDRYRGVIRIP